MRQSAPDNLAASRIVVVDDEEATIALLVEGLRAGGYRQVSALTDPASVPGMIDAMAPDLVIIDLHMPGLDGSGLIQRIRSGAGAEIPILVVTADTAAERRYHALESGATDFLTKPVDVVEVALRVRNLLQVRHLHRELVDQKTRLEEMVAERTVQLEASQREMAQRLALAAEYRDDITGRHTMRVGELSARIAEALGVPETDLDVIRLAAPLHDIGKIAIPDEILLKPGPLTPDEYEQVQAHVSIGASILSGGSSPILVLAEKVALTHHERWDGSGYLGLSGEDIPLPARIVSVADVYDALCNIRPYKPAWPKERAVAEIIRLSGSHFDPAVVEVFLELEA